VSAGLNIPNVGSGDYIATRGVNQTFTGTNIFNTAHVYDTGFQIMNGSDATKQIQFGSSLNATGQFLVIESQQSSSQALYVPNISGSDTIDTLNTNQTVVGTKIFNSIRVYDTGFQINNSSDATKQITFNTSLNTTGTYLDIVSQQSSSQVLYVPNITGTDTLASLVLPQTFTGAKTFNGGVLFATTGGTPTNLNYYEDLSTTLVFGADTYASGVTANVRFIRTGKMCMFSLLQIVTGTATQAGNLSVPSIPSRFLPYNSGSGYSLNHLVPGTNNSVASTCVFEYDSSVPRFFFYPSISVTGQFTGSGTASIQPFSCVYPVP
jgi:hypothetical protein